MNTKTYNTENLTAYLLGALPEADAEIFDELSFTDDGFAGELSAAEKELVDSYVSGELKGENLKNFESFYLASPLRREKVEFARNFQAFAAKEMADKPVAVVESPPKHGLAQILSNVFLIRRPFLQWGLAFAALVFMILGVWLLRENVRLGSEISESQRERDELLKRESELQEREKQLQAELANRQTANSETEKELAKIREERAKLEQELKIRQSQQQQRLTEQRAENQRTPNAPEKRGLSIASFILTPALRGSGQLQSVSIPPKTAAVALRLELEPNDYAAYRVVLKNQSGDRILWRSGKLKSKSSGANKVLSVGFPAALLKTEIYSLEVSGLTATGAVEIISDYPFRVVR